jgi:proteic killer suppression protein
MAAAPAANIGKQVAALRGMTPADLRETYREVFGEESRSRHKDFLRKRIAWRLQANEEGELSERAKRRAAEIANDAGIRVRVPSGASGAGLHAFARTTRRAGWANVSKTAARKLDMLDYAAVLTDLNSPPGNRLEALKGDLRGLHGIRVNDQWRIVFRWTPSGPAEVDVRDYH